MIVVGVLSCFSKWLKVQITSNNNVLRKKRLKLNPKSKVPNTGHKLITNKTGLRKNIFCYHIHRVKSKVNFIIDCMQIEYESDPDTKYCDTFNMKCHTAMNSTIISVRHFIAKVIIIILSERSRVQNLF